MWVLTSATLGIMALILLGWIYSVALRVAKRKEDRLRYELEYEKAKSRKEMLRNMPLDDLVSRSNERARSKGSRRSDFN